MKMKKKQPLYEDAERCIELRKKSRTGTHNSEEDHKFVMKMFKKYPEWYSETEDRVFNETVPFGSNLKRVNGKLVIQN
jgi:hypothetical protein